MASYVVKAAVVKVSVGEAGGNRVARILRAGSPVPEGVAEEQLKALAERGLISKASSSSSSQASDAKPYTEGADPAGFNIKALQAYVGDDADRAAAVLELETAPDAKARGSLIDWLTPIAGSHTPEPGSGDGSGSGD